MAEDLGTRLRGQGLRLTPQRELILSAVEELGHATPDEVLAHVQDRASAVNQSTVYRTLELLESLGLVRHAHLGGRAPTYHSTAEPEHGHLVCRQCGAETTLTADAAHDFAEQLSASEGFLVDVGHLTVFGTCRECAQE